MKRSKQLIIFSIITLLFFGNSSFSQDLEICEMIGQKLSKVVAKFGKPAHEDKSNPAMECVFYKTKNYQMVFVANKEGVFQIDGWKDYGKESSAYSALNKLLSKCTKNNFVVDTMSETEYKLQKGIIQFTTSLIKNNHTNKYQIKIKAHKGAL